MAFGIGNLSGSIYCMYTRLTELCRQTEHRRRQWFHFMTDTCKDMWQLCTTSQAVFRLSLQPAMLRSIRKIAPVCGTIACQVILRYNDKLHFCRHFGLNPFFYWVGLVPSVKQWFEPVQKAWTHVKLSCRFCSLILASPVHATMQTGWVRWTSTPSTWDTLGFWMIQSKVGCVTQNAKIMYNYLISILHFVSCGTLFSP